MTTVHALLAEREQALKAFHLMTDRHARAVKRCGVLEKRGATDHQHMMTALNRARDELVLTTRKLEATENVRDMALDANRVKKRRVEDLEARVEDLEADAARVKELEARVKDLEAHRAADAKTSERLARRYAAKDAEIRNRKSPRRSPRTLEH